MNIKELLKNYNIKLSDLAEIFNLSRPTLNNYIKEFETTSKLNNDFYNKIFTELFNSNSCEDFNNILNKWKGIINKPDNYNDDYNHENLYLMNSIIKKMKTDMKGQKDVNILYKFINSAISNYNTSIPLNGYIDYFLYLNGLKDLKTISDDKKILISNLYPIMKKYYDDNLNFNEMGYEEFKIRVAQIEKLRKIELKKDFLKLKREAFKKLKLGIDPKDIDLQELILKLKK